MKGEGEGEGLKIIDTGNAAVIYVILRSRRMRSITNFFLANLAFADFCVGVFCVLPTLKTYLDTIWVLGRVMCKLNYFIQQMAFVASVSILTVIAIERYVAIVYPMKSKQLTTKKRLIFFIVLIWLTAIFYNVIQLVVFDTEGTTMGGMRFEFCIITVKFDRRTYYTFNFFLWYLIPLILMTAIYTRIGIVLWTSTMLTNAAGNSAGNNNQNGPAVAKTYKLSRHAQHEVPGKEEEGILMTNYKHSDEISVVPTAGQNVLLIKNGSPSLSTQTIALSSKEQGSQTWGRGGRSKHPSPAEETIEEEITTCTSSSEPTCLGSRSSRRGQHQQCRKRIQDVAQKSKAGGAENVLKSRRKVVRLLVLVVGSFAACSLPFQVRVLMQAWGGNVPSIVPPITILIMFFNSGLNPILYAFFSENFRRAMKEVFICKLGRRGRQRTDPLASRVSGVHSNL